jgi:hypothetical protein
MPQTNLSRDPTTLRAPQPMKPAHVPQLGAPLPSHREFVLKTVTVCFCYLITDTLQDNELRDCIQKHYPGTLTGDTTKLVCFITIYLDFVMLGFPSKELVKKLSEIIVFTAARHWTLFHSSLN